MSNVYSQHVYDPSTKQWAVLTAGTSYDDLTDQPVRNAKGGSPEAFVNMAGLEVGHYSLTGYYKKDSSYEIEQALSVLDVVVCIDTVTSKKVIVFPSVEDGEYLINKITYNGSTVETVEKLALGGGSTWGDF